MKLHHIAIIVSDYEKSKAFYTDILGFEVIQEIYRTERQSYKLDLAINGQYILELFSFPNPPKRPSYPESCGLRHLAFSVENIKDKHTELTNKLVKCEAIRTDVFTEKSFFFIEDPDHLPIEFYEE